MIDIKTTNTILYCRNWQETVAFYKDQLKLPVTAAFDWFVEFGLNAGARLSVADESRASINSSGGQGVTVTFQVADIEQTRQYLQESGLQPTPIKDHAWGARVMYLHDPEGHRLEFWC